MKQILAGALSGFQGLGSDDFRERPVDRLAALGAIQIARVREAQREAALCTLGVDLIAWKFGQRTHSKAPAGDNLALALAWSVWKLRLNDRERRRVALWAIHEWANDACPTCKGAQQVPDRQEIDGAQPMKPCPDCATGKKRYTDIEREHALGSVYDKALSVAHAIIGNAEALAVRRTAQMLERWPNDRSVL